ncbi:S8 family serine peptidase [Leptospira vanthielii]|uniref:Peptidase, S8/S53 family n=1 Tax=Leptospira vanthielii serovar Holland str. Waz Holland = ATCC 700522 TaxID=1218591 RepID=N1W9T9_9LEPT|nr:S8 family serine peptidase [Leptospira vanthielii]EMY70210.1 peptidase, S8/S53 family [Leptospira vanthielii serovar Holland str. Waz Holland = ATCC 700522]
MNFNKKSISKLLIVATMLVATNILISEPVFNLDQTKLDLDALRAKSKAGQKLPYLPGEVVITFKKQVPDSELVHQTSKLAASNTGVLNLKGHFATARLFGSETMEEGLARIKKDPNVESVEPRYLYYKQASAPNDPEFARLWGLSNIGQTVASPSYTANSSNPGTSGKDMNVLGAWDVTTSCNNTIVAVLDTGVTYTHQDLVGNMWDGSGGCVNQNGVAIGGGCPNHGYDFASGDNNPRDEEGHGTHVAMTIGAVGNNNIGISGVCQSAKIMAVRVLGLGGGTNDNIANGIYFAVRNGAKVINMSLGGSSFSSAIDSAIEFARTNDVLVVVAAGNDGKNLNTDGAAYPCENTNANVICISALDQKHALANFSNYDSNGTLTSRAADFGAPGTNIYSGYGTEVSYNENSTSYSDWTYSTVGTAWASSTCTLSNYKMLVSADCTLANVLFDSSVNTMTTMALNTESIVYKNFTIPAGATNVSLSHFIVSVGERQNSTTCYDYIQAKYSATASNPVAGTTLTMFDGNIAFPNQYQSQLCRNGGTAFVSNSADTKILTNCIGGAGTNCTVGYRLVTDTSGAYQGGLVGDVFLTAWAPSTTAYTNLNGTSMATPNAAGVAALIRSYNPSFTYSDVITKLIEGGVTETALTGTTQYGKAINANASLKHLKQVTGVTAVLQ